jgi:UDP-N-acetylmuramoyl-L-alanyl-D-glutamate--2,6-diaminopimelate ligase
MTDEAILAKLQRLARGVPLCQDSRRVVPGSIFFLTCRDRAQAPRYAQEAEQKGARAIVTSREMRSLPVGIPVYTSDNPRRLLAYLAAASHGLPAEHLDAFAVTGTSGKTTAAEYVRSVLTAAHLAVGAIGSIHPVPGAEGLTTPPAPELQAELAAMVRAGLDAVVIEVSSHGIDQDRVGAIRFKGALLTNLGRDHLDYHGTLARYWEVKARLFRCLGADAVAALPDERRVHAVIGPLRARVVTYGLKRGDVHLLAVEPSSLGRRLTLSLAGRRVETELRLPGPGPLRSALGAAAMGLGLGVPADVVERGIAAVTAVPGRMERWQVGGRTIWIDYAHNPVGLEACLTGVREETMGAVWHVFGGRGGRDRGKLPLMGRVSERLADHTILTTDLPEGEDPAALAAAIQRGMRKRSARFIPDRRQALRQAYEESAPGDAIVLTGRGDEPAREIAGGLVQAPDPELVAELQREVSRRTAARGGKGRAAARASLP